MIDRPTLFMMTLQSRLRSSPVVIPAISLLEDETNEPDVEFIFGSWKDNAESKKEMTIENVFIHRLEILANPADFSQKITHFSAGGLGACAYNKDVTVAELVRCWEFEEFQFACPESGETAYIYQFAGHVGAGGYWELTAYCPANGKHLHYSRRDFNPVNVSWAKLKGIADPVSRQIQNIKTKTESGK